MTPLRADDLLRWDLLRTDVRRLLCNERWAGDGRRNGVAYCEDLETVRTGSGALSVESDIGWRVFDLRTNWT